jgi:chromosome segregation ATPase
MVEDLSMRIYNIEINQRKMMERITALESCCDDKSDPESLPIGHGLSKEQIADKLLFNKQREIEELKQLSVKMQTALDEVWQERDRYKNKLVLKEKDLEESSREHHRLNDLINTIQRENEDLKQTVNQQAASIHTLYTKNQQLEKDVEYWKKLVDVTEKDRQKAVNKIDVYQCGLEKKIEELQYKIKGDDESYRIQERLLSECEDSVRKLRDENQKLLLENSWLLKRAAEDCK